MGRIGTAEVSPVVADAIDKSFDAPGQPENRRFSRLKVTTPASTANLRRILYQAVEARASFLRGRDSNAVPRADSAFPVWRDGPSRRSDAM
ncbi:MAG: hypothetical protein ABI610_11910 [Acidobacteriota bacterium]